MAASDQIKSLIKSYGEEDDDRFFASALQIAAAEARKGHTNLAQDLKKLIEKAKVSKSLSFADRGKTIPILHPKRELKDLLDIFQPRIKLEDMVLNEQVKEPLERLVFEQKSWQLLKKHDLQPVRKILLKGPPGCGKTMTAQALAGELGIPVFIVRLDGIISKFMGESISKLRLIFDAMVDNRGVYLFDEFDSIGSHRDQGQDVGEIKRVLNSFLINIEKDQSNSIIIAATNLPDSLDKALFRRFDEVIAYPLPNQEEIIEALKKAFRGYSFEKRVAYKAITKEAIGLNFSDITRVADDTIKTMILSKKEKLSNQELITAIRKRK